MHESTMTPDEVEELRRHVIEFFETRKHTSVAIAEAQAHFRSLGHTITRPIENTLQAHGVVRRSLHESTRRKYPFTQRDDAWTTDGHWLRPASTTPEETGPSRLV